MNFVRDLINAVWFASEAARSEDIRITSLKISETREEINVSQQAGPNLEGVGINHSVSHIDVCINAWGKFALARKRCIGAG
ncbi:hypothetical protein GB937_010345 [Aspergillus fischeri]|nr:hypothetical protein GB937_010345 [Aspergillus fischeri]